MRTQRGHRDANLAQGHCGSGWIAADLTLGNVGDNVTGTTGDQRDHRHTGTDDIPAAVQDDADRAIDRSAQGQLADLVVELRQLCFMNRDGDVLRTQALLQATLLLGQRSRPQPHLFQVFV